MLEVAIDRTFPHGRVLGIDVIPAQPPKGVSTIQGNFLSPAVQDEVKRFLRDPGRGMARLESSFSEDDRHKQMTSESLEEHSLSLLELENHTNSNANGVGNTDLQSRNWTEEGTVDVVLSDMSEPWAQPGTSWKRSLSDPYYRMMNTSGMSFRDHSGSMVRNEP